MTYPQRIPSQIAPTYVLYHRNCPDGMAAAYAAYKRMGEFATYIPLTYTDPMPEIPEGAFVFMLDFTLKRAALIELASRVSNIIILDHHRSAEADLLDLGLENVKVVFNMDKSGAQIAWAFFHPQLPEPEVITYIADRDLWTFKLRDTDEISNAVMSYEYDFGVYESLIEGGPITVRRLYAEGTALVRQKEKQLSDLLKEVQGAWFRTGNDEAVLVPVVNAPYFLGSDLAHRLLLQHPEAPFAATYRDGGDGRRDWSIRSLDDRMDVSKVAVYNGGGGHRNASGMSELSPEQKVVLTGQSYDEKLWEDVFF
jgi:hypothetical protein